MELRNEMSGLGGLSEKASLSHEAESLCDDEIGVDSRMMGCCGSEESNTSSDNCKERSCSSIKVDFTGAITLCITCA